MSSLNDCDYRTPVDALYTEKMMRFFFYKKNAFIISRKLSGKHDVYVRETKSNESIKKKCDICGCDLFQRIVSEDGKLLIKPLNHFKLTSTDNRHFYTCYRWNMCFNRISWKDNDEFESDDFTAPPFEIFIKIEGIDRQSEEILSAKSNYQEFVVPFIERWAGKYINKSNVLQFNVEIESVLDQHLKYYDESAHKIIINRIYELIGVLKNDR